MRFLLLITVRAYSAWLFAVMIAENHLRDNWYGWAAFLTAFVKLERSDGIKTHAYASTVLDLMDIRPPVPDEVVEGDTAAVFAAAPATDTV
mmetsp:Transcript_4033/g.9175  ORF Transcript_4033/g.9175 Transcript_4033/m.9175 type:complete len:91 (-) Transcript_4033:236-508(-)